MIASILDIVLRTGVVYIVLILGLRLLGKRHVAQLSTVDFVLILLLSNAVQNAMVGNDTSLLGGIVAAITLLLLSYLLSFIMYRSRAAKNVLEGTPTLLIRHGQFIREHLEKEKITEEELLRVVNEHGIENLDEVGAAIMEPDGTVSVLPRTPHERKIETFKHRRLKYQQRKIT